MDGQGVPAGAYLPDGATIPDGYELQGQLATRDAGGEALERWYVNEVDERDLRVVTTEAVARTVCDAARERLRGDHFFVQPAVIGGMPAVVAERRLGLSYERAAYVASGSACLGVMTLGQQDRVPDESEEPILSVMLARVRTN